MKEKGKKIMPSMSTIVIALSVFIIAESIWLVGKLEEISDHATNKDKNFPALVQQDPVKTDSAAVIALEGPTGVVQGETFVVKAILKANKAFYSHGMDVVVDYDPQMFEVLAKAQVDPSSPFKTAGLNSIEEEKKRILVTLIDMSGKGFTFVPEDDYPLFEISFKALKSGEASLGIGEDKEGARKTQIIDANTDELLPLDKEELIVVVS